MGIAIVAMINNTALRQMNSLEQTSHAGNDLNFSHAEYQMLRHEVARVELRAGINSSSVKAEEKCQLAESHGAGSVSIKLKIAFAVDELKL